MRRRFVASAQRFFVLRPAGRPRRFGAPEPVPPVPAKYVVARFWPVFVMRPDVIASARGRGSSFASTPRAERICSARSPDGLLPRRSTIDSIMLAMSPAERRPRRPPRPRRRGAAAAAAASLLSDARGRPGPRRAGAALRPATSASSSIEALRSAPRTLAANCDARLSIVLRRLLMAEANTALWIRLAINFKITKSSPKRRGASVVATGLPSAPRDRPRNRGRGGLSRAKRYACRAEATGA